MDFLSRSTNRVKSSLPQLVANYNPLLTRLFNKDLPSSEAHQCFTLCSRLQSCADVVITRFLFCIQNNMETLRSFNLKQSTEQTYSFLCFSLELTGKSSSRAKTGITAEVKTNTTSELFWILCTETILCTAEWGIMCCKKFYVIRNLSEGDLTIQWH